MGSRILDLHGKGYYTHMYERNAMVNAILQQKLRILDELLDKYGYIL